MAALLDQAEPVRPLICGIGGDEHLFYAGRTNSLFGDSETGKTLLTVVTAIQTARAGQRALFVDFEDSIQGLARLLAAFQITEEEAARIHYINPEEPLIGQETANDFKAALEIGASLVTIDGVGAGMALHGLNPNQQTDVARFLRMTAKPAAQTGAAVILIDHVTRDPEKRTQAIGSIEKKAAISGASFEVRLIKAFAPGSEGKATLRLNKDRPGGIRRRHPGLHPTVTTFIVDSTTTTSTWKFEQSIEQAGADWRPTYYMEQVSILLEGTYGGLSQNQIETMATGESKLIRKAVAFLVADGYVKVEPGPRNSKLHFSVRRYRQDDLGSSVDLGLTEVEGPPVVQQTFEEGSKNDLGSPRFDLGLTAVRPTPVTSVTSSIPKTRSETRSDTETEPNSVNRGQPTIDDIDPAAGFGHRR